MALPSLRETSAKPDLKLADSAVYLEATKPTIRVRQKFSPATNNRAASSPRMSMRGQP